MGSRSCGKLRRPQGRLGRQALSPGLLDAMPAQIVRHQPDQLAMLVEPLRHPFQLATDLVIGEEIEYAGLDGAFLTHCRAPAVAVSPLESVTASMAQTQHGRSRGPGDAYQSRSQPAAIYGDKRAEILWDNMESIVFYRPATGNRSTGKYLEDILGEISGFARSETEHDGQRASESKSERAIPLL